MVVIMAFRGDRLQTLRRSKGFNQADLAEQTGTSQSMVGRYETGESDPSADVVIRLAQFFEVTADYLLGLTDDPLGRLEEDDLSPTERKLIAALRAGLITEALDNFNDIAKTAKTNK
jgi:transcriptional regulator with XRE-family HTH domain